MRAERLAAIWVFVLLSACQTPTRRGSLHYTTARREGRPPFASPLIHGSIGGRRTQIVIDTGAQASVVLGWLARQAELPTRDTGIEGADPSGQPLKLLQTDRPEIELDGFGRIENQPTLVVDMPAFFEQAGIGAILSPQSITRSDEALVIDLLAGELSRQSAAGVASSLGELPIALTNEQTRICVSDAGSMQARIIVTPAMVNDRPALVELDTGASLTMVVEDSEAGRSLASFPVLEERTALGAVGGIAMKKLGEVPLAIGEFSAKKAVGLIPGAAHPTCGYEGRIGIDVLRGCVLAISATSVVARCR